MSKKAKRLMAVIVIALMVGTASVFHDREIIFPEIAAIATGCLVAPKLSWKTDPVRILITIMICALLGMGIVAYVHLPAFYEMVIAYLIGQCIMLTSQTTFAPMISAIVLPVMLQSKSMNYIYSALVFTSLILFVYVFRNKHLRWPSYSPMWTKANALMVVKRTLISLFGITFAFVADVRFAVAPPLLVAFTEFTNPTAKARKVPLKSIVLIFGSAAIGAYSRYLLTMSWHLPLVLPAILTSVCFILMMDKLKLYLPPAGAIGILAMLIPEKAVLLFPFQAGLGITVMMILALTLFKGE